MPSRNPEPLAIPGQVNDSWSMDFVSDQLFNGRRIRALTVVDNFSRECLAITVDAQLKGDDVVATMEHLRLLRGLPLRIQVDNGSEFISKVLDKWAYENQVVLDFSRPGKSTDNPFIESFNGSFRDECLNLHWFLSRMMHGIRSKAGVWTTITTVRTARWADRHRLNSRLRVRLRTPLRCVLRRTRAQGHEPGFLYFWEDGDSGGGHDPDCLPVLPSL